MRLSARVLASLVACLIQLGGGAWAAGNSYSIVVSSWKSRESAERGLKEVQGEMGPVEIAEFPNDPLGFQFKVLSGKYPTYADAWSRKHTSSRVELKRAPIFKREGIEPGASTLPLAGTLSLDLPSQAKAAAAQGSGKIAARKVDRLACLQRTGLEGGGAALDGKLLLKPIDTLSTAELLAVGLNAPDETAGLAALKKFLTAVPEGADAQRARFRLARRYAKTGQYDLCFATVDQIQAKGTATERAMARYIRTYTKKLKEGTASAAADFDALAKDPDLPADLLPEVRRAAASAAYAKGDIGQSLTYFLAVANDESAPEDARAEAMLSAANLAYKQKDLPVAFERFMAVSRNPATTETQRSEAVHRAASVAHLKGEFAVSWVLFSQLKETTTDTSIAAEAAVQLAGLAMEMSHRSIGNMEDVTTLAEAAKAMPGASDDCRATAELMRLESLFYREEFEQLIPQVDAFLQASRGAKHQVVTAKVLKGAALSRLGRLDEATTILEEVARMPAGGDEKFGKIDQRAQALQWLAETSGAKSDKTKRDAYLNELRTKYPDTPEAKEALKFHSEQDALKAAAGGPVSSQTATQR